MAGEYKELLKEYNPDLRIAFTHTPIIGCAIRNDLVPSILEVLEKSASPHAGKYVAGLKDGTMVPVMPLYSKFVPPEMVSMMDKVWAPGELFLKS